MSTEAVEDRSRPLINSRGMVLMMALASGLALGITAIPGRQSLSDLLREGKPWPAQLAWGIAIGLLFAVPASAAVSRVPWFERFRRQMLEIASRADLSGFNPLWFSLCAGAGEELLFRGALQPLVGLWLTSLIFTGLHFRTGGFGSMNRMKAIYALTVFLASLLLGTVFVHIGLIAAIVTHTVVDLIALTSLAPHGPRKVAPAARDF